MRFFDAVLRLLLIVFGLSLVLDATAQSTDFSFIGSYSQLLIGDGAVYATMPDGTGYRVIKKFAANPDGQHPVGQLLRTSDGFIYGVCSSGGSGTGTIFEMKEDGTGFHVIHSFDASTFSPGGGLVLGKDGYLFGVAAAQVGTSGGWVYKLKRDGSAFSKVYNFVGQDYVRGAVLAVDADWTIYGICKNIKDVLFKLDPDGSNFTYLDEFTDIPTSGFALRNILIASNGYIYGTTCLDGTNDKGTFFRVKKDGTSFSRIHFPATFHTWPVGNLIELNGKVIGIAPAASEGMLMFSVDLNWTNFQVLPIASSAGIGRSSAGLTVTPDGKIAGLSLPVSLSGGTLFKMDANGGNLSVLHSFDSFHSFNLVGTHTSQPVITSNGDLVGAREYGFASQNGGIYRFTVGGTLIVDKEFPQPEGSQPMGNLAKGSEGFYYGITQLGGSSGTGVIYKMKKDGSSYEVLHNINKAPHGNSIFSEYGGLTIGTDGYLYGTTNNGGNNKKGSVYRISTSGQNFETLAHFDGAANGSWPTGNLMEGSDGFLYGLTMNGGASDRGTLFKVMKDGTGFQKLHDFNGLQPSGNSLSEGTDNYLLGIAKSGGSNNRGAVFKIKKDGTGFEVVKDFDDNTGEATQGGSLASHPDGNFYGLALRTPLSGTLFRIAGNGTAFQIIYTFDLVGPANSLTLAPDGNFFAITGAGGKIFRIRNDGTGFQQASLLPGGLIEPRPLNPNFALIERSTQTITFAAMSSLTYGDDDQVLTATSDSGLPITYLSTNSNVASVTGNTLKITGAGTATIRATQPGDALFKPAEIVSQQLHVAKAPHVITFGPLEQMKMSPQPFELHGTSTSALPLVYINSNASVATVSGNKVTLIGIGSTTITATQPGNNNYLPASDVSQDLVVTKGDQTITFPEISSKTLGGAAFQLTATAPAPVTYSTMSDKVTIAESTVTMVKAGRLSIIASQNGNANYNAAAPVERSFCINPPKPVVTITVTNATVTFTSSNSSGNQWYRDETVITNATQASFQSNDFGAYSVKTTVDDCVSEMSAPFVVTSTRDENDESITYTNPVSTVLTVWVSSAHDSEVQFQLIDMLGRPTLSASGWTNRENTIEVGHLAKGMYVLRVSGERNAAVRVHAARVYKE